MRAMVLDKPAPAENAPLVARVLPRPRPVRGEVLVRVEACGVCRTDLHTVEGEIHLPLLPVVPGHQVVGVIEGGHTSGEARVGSRVGLAWMWGACGECAACAAGRENLCERAQFTGCHTNGGYAEYVRARSDYVYPLPSDVRAENLAPLLCAGVVGYRALRLAGALGGGRLGVFGFGASAHIAIQVARHAGCEVYVFSRAERHLEHARQLGARWVGPPTATPPEKLDTAVIFSPAGEHVLAALTATTAGGTVACAGVTMSDIPAFPYSLLSRERRLVSVANATRADARELLDIAPRIPIVTSVEAMPLEQANQALLRVKRSQVTGSLILVPG